MALALKVDFYRKKSFLQSSYWSYVINVPTKWRKSCKNKKCIRHEISIISLCMCLTNCFANSHFFPPQTKISMKDIQQKEKTDLRRMATGYAIYFIVAHWNMHYISFDWRIRYFPSNNYTVSIFLIKSTVCMVLERWNKRPLWDHR